MLRVAMRMARRRLGALFAVLCAVLGGAALVAATAVLADSGWRSHVSAPRLAGADVVISAAQTVSQDQDLPVALPERAVVPGALASRFAGIPGVAKAVGDVSFPAVALDGGRVVPDGDAAVAGHGWSSVALIGTPAVRGVPPAGPEEVALDAATAAALRVEPGGQANLVVAGKPGAYRVTAVIDAKAGSLFFADPVAKALAGRADGPRRDTVDLVGLRAEPGAAGAVAAEAKKLAAPQGLEVSTGAEIGDVVSPSSSAARFLLFVIAGSLAGITLLVVGFIVAGALSVAVSGQRRELALLRAVGATPRQIRRLAASQATVIALLGLAPGVVLGYSLAGQFRNLLVTLGVLPDALPLTTGPLPAAAAVLLLFLVIQVAARLGAWRTSKMPATEAVAESGSEPATLSAGRIGTGALLIAAATVLSITPLLIKNQAGATGTSLAGIVAAIGLALAGPAMVQFVSGALARWLPAQASPATWLAVANSHGYALRVAGAVSTLAMVILFTLTYTMTQTTVMAAGDKEIDAGLRAQVAVGAPALGGLPDGTLAKVAATQGVEAASPVSSTTVLWPHLYEGRHRATSQAALVLAPSASAVLDLGVESGDFRGLTGSAVAVSADAAESMDTAVGRDLDLILGDGARVKARVVAVYSRGLGFGPMAISRELAAGHTSGLDSAVLARTDGSQAAADRLAALSREPGLVVSKNPKDGLGNVGGAPPAVWVNLAALAVLLSYILLGVANKLVASTSRRREELAALRLIGTTPAQIRAMIRREGALISAMAIGTGFVLSAIPLAILGVGFLGRPWPSGPVWLLPAALLGVVAIAFLATELPARRVLRTPPEEVLASRD
ncbi:FtsX-like permease family protein [Amycolatopsis sp. NPDC004079]|uniref:FtsX-like permease family protein n=1 Tax=Amycolatopsis sp. NPDC004079 TaxID=3154549 RepID=UPI0033A7B814